MTLNCVPPEMFAMRREEGHVASVSSYFEAKFFALMNSVGSRKNRLKIPVEEKRCYFTDATLAGKQRSNLG